MNQNVDQVHGYVHKADNSASLRIGHEFREADQAIQEANYCALVHHLNQVCLEGFINRLEVEQIAKNHKRD